jgi:hypothetical protein
VAFYLLVKSENGRIHGGRFYLFLFILSRDPVICHVALHKVVAVPPLQV